MSVYAGGEAKHSHNGAVQQHADTYAINVYSQGAIVCC